MATAFPPTHHHADTLEYQAVMDRYAIQTQGNVKANEPYKIKLSELIGLASFTAGSVAVTSRPMLDKHIGGASLLGVGLVVADLHHRMFGGRVVEAAQRLFGGSAHAMQAMGVLACSVLSGGTFTRMVRDGGVRNPADPRWLSVAATGAYFMSGHVMMEPHVKHWVESKFGESLTLARNADDQKHLEVPTAPFFKQLAFVIGGAHILAYGMIEKENISKFIGAAFMVGPSLSLGNLLWKGAQESHRERTDPNTRIHYLSVTDPKDDALDYAKIALKPLVDEQGDFQFDRFAEMLDAVKMPQKNR
jgi:hypothetical protein